MILVDTPLWIDHLHRAVPELDARLDRSEVFGHPWVVGELAIGGIADRDRVLGSLDDLPLCLVAADRDVRRAIERHRLFGLGIGWVDAGLLASTLLTPDARLWTRDRRLQAAAERLGVAHPSG